MSRCCARSRATHAGIVTIEENVVAGGAGSACSEALDAEGLIMPRLHLGIPDRFIEHGSRDDCLAAAGLDLAGIAASHRALALRRVPALKLTRSRHQIEPQRAASARVEPLRR